jgi:hypothetical protein
MEAYLGEKIGGEINAEAGNLVGKLARKLQWRTTLI